MTTPDPLPEPKVWTEAELEPIAKMLGLTLDGWLDHLNAIRERTKCPPIVHVVGEKPERLIQIDPDLARIVWKRGGLS